MQERNIADILLHLNQKVVNFYMYNVNISFIWQKKNQKHEEISYL